MPGEAAARRAIMSDARLLRVAMALYQEALSVHRDELDSLNVFPVPDGDTGTNLLFTQRAVTAALSLLNPAEEDEVAAVREVVEAAALRAARGNSGVILAAVLRALCDSLPAPSERLAGWVLAEAFDAASQAAWRAVVDPKEGTALTVLREAAAGARRAAAGAADDAAAVSREALAAAAQALAETRHQRPELERAGVVDAGALGLVLLIDCIRAAVVGDGPSIPVGPYGPVGRPGADGPSRLSEDGAFEVQFIVHADEESIERLRRDLVAGGTSLAISGERGTYAVHVHTDDPERALAAGAAAGAVEDRAVRPFDARPEEPSGGSVPAGQVRTGLVAVADGAGLERVFRSLGAVVVAGGPGRNPPVAVLQSALTAAGAEGAILLPNHPTVVPAARAAAESGERSAVVVDARSIPAGLAAAAAYRADATVGQNAREMSAAGAAVRAGEVGIAAVAVDTAAGPVRPGDWFAAVGETVVEIGDEPAPVAVRLVERLIGRAEAELITVVLGEGAAAPEVDNVCEALREAGPGLRVDVIVGGQPHHRYLIGVE